MNTTDTRPLVKITNELVVLSTSLLTGRGIRKLGQDLLGEFYYATTPAARATIEKTYDVRYEDGNGKWVAL